MKKSLLSFFTVTLLCLMTGKPVMAQELPAQKETLETIVKVNDYFMKKYADYT
ncbi:glycoside hydrolase family 88 protein, partial [Bacteroides xylanisolvens]